MDVNLITKIAAAGAMGVSAYCIIKVYDLLKNEQKKESPRPIFIKTIYASMAFAILMTVLSLGIEIVRHQLIDSGSDIETTLNSITKENYYSLNKNGNPKDIRVSYNEQNYTLSKALPETKLSNNELKLKLDSNRFLAIKQNIEQEIVYGYFEASEIKTKAALLFTDKQNKQLDATELWALGLTYTPQSTSQIIQYKVKEDRCLAIEYITRYIALNENDNRSNKEKAIKMLTQPELMNKLNNTQYEILINALQAGFRETPWDKYELAQVYLSRSWQTWNKTNAEDKTKHKLLLSQYASYYKDNTWIQDTSKFSNEYRWYLESIEKLGGS